jgi:hypothetical protein
MWISKKIFIVGVVIIVLIGLGIWLGLRFGNSSTAADSPYSAVYLSSGDIYFGKLDWFPKPHIENAWHLSSAVDAQNHTQPTLLPLKNLFWGPSQDLYLNEKQIIFWTKLRADSQVAKALADPSSVQSVNSATPSVSTSTK